MCRRYPGVLAGEADRDALGSREVSRLENAKHSRAPNDAQATYFTRFCPRAYVAPASAPASLPDWAPSSVITLSSLSQNAAADAEPVSPGAARVRLGRCRLLEPALTSWVTVNPS